MVISGNNLVVNGTTVEQADLINISSITGDIQTQLGLKAPLESPSFTGNVGIGTSSPSTKLYISATGGDLSSTTVTRANTVGGITLFSSDNLSNRGNGLWFNNGSLLAGIASARASTSDWGTDLRFYTHDTSTTNVDSTYERMRIDSAGNVGIGTSSPSTFSPNSTYTNIVSTVKSDQALSFGSYYQGGVEQYSFIKSSQVGSPNAASDLRFFGGNTERMRINLSGNLLVGTTTDNGVDKLQVNGSVTASNVYGEVINYYSVAAGATLTQVFSLPQTYSKYEVYAYMNGSNMVLVASANFYTTDGLNTVAGFSNKFIGDYNVGSIDIQTYNNIAAFSQYYTNGGLKGQVVVTNGTSDTQSLMIKVKKVI